MMTRAHSDTLNRLQHELQRTARRAPKAKPSGLDRLWRILHGYEPATRTERETAYRELLAAGVNV